MTFPWGHRLLPFVWYVEACVAVAALWTLFGGGRARDALAAAAYLVLCGAAAGLPGSLLLGLAARTKVPARGRRWLLHVYLAVAAGAVAGLLATGRGWSAAVAILMTGNAIWAIEADARRTARAGGPQTPVSK
jgi:hypothetical protein